MIADRTASQHIVGSWNQASISNGFRDIQWRMWRNGGMTLNDLWTKVKVIHFGTNRFLIYNSL